MSRLIALDLHRKSLFVVAADAQGQELWRRRFPTTLAGETALLAPIEPTDRVVLEATNGAFRLAHRLESRGAQVLVADPQHARLVGLRGKKTDYRDCRALLEHLRAGTLIAVWRPDAATREIRQLTRERQAYNQSIVALKNRIRALLWDEGIDTPERLWTQEGQAWLAAQRLTPLLRRLLDREVAALAALTAVKEAQEEELAQRATQQPAAQRLLQVAGFGPAAAMMFLGQVGPVDRFPAAKQLVSYSGLDPRVHQSGDKCRSGSLSKAGRTPLRWIMIEVAWAHVAAKGPEAERYHRLVAQGKPKGVAIAALARHLLVLAYQLLSKEEPYRRVDARKFEDKLQALAAFRPPTEELELTHTAWAAERLGEITGLPSPYEQAHPRARPLRRRKARSRTNPLQEVNQTIARALTAPSGRLGVEKTT
jgi:transposase